MRSRFNILLAVASLALVTLACQAMTGSPVAPATDVVVENTVVPANTDMPAPTQMEEPTVTVNSDVLLDDDFSAGGRTSWGTGTDADSSVEYKDDGLNMQLFKENYIVWSSPNDNEY